MLYLLPIRCRAAPLPYTRCARANAPPDKTLGQASAAAGISRTLRKSPPRNTVLPQRARQAVCGRGTLQHQPFRQQIMHGFSYKPHRGGYSAMPQKKLYFQTRGAHHVPATTAALYRQRLPAARILHLLVRKRSPGEILRRKHLESANIPLYSAPPWHRIFI